jgi:hypothetical protein
VGKDWLLNFTAALFASRFISTEWVGETSSGPILSEYPAVVVRHGQRDIKMYSED